MVELVGFAFGRLQSVPVPQLIFLCLGIEFDSNLPLGFSFNFGDWSLRFLVCCGMLVDWFGDVAGCAI